MHINLFPSPLVSCIVSEAQYRMKTCGLPCPKQKHFLDSNTELEPIFLHMSSLLAIQLICPKECPQTYQTDCQGLGRH